jgi:hypothetical protein
MIFFSVKTIQKINFATEQFFGFLALRLARIIFQVLSSLELFFKLLTISNNENWLDRIPRSDFGPEKGFYQEIFLWLWILFMFWKNSWAAFWSSDREAAKQLCSKMWFGAVRERQTMGQSELPAPFSFFLSALNGVRIEKATWSLDPSPSHKVASEISWARSVLRCIDAPKTAHTASALFKVEIKIELLQRRRRRLSFSL